MKQNYVTLNDGKRIPQFGDYLGAWNEVRVLVSAGAR